jgi:hypothetical protein
MREFQLRRIINQYVKRIANISSPTIPNQLICTSLYEEFSAYTRREKSKKDKKRKKETKRAIIASGRLWVIKEIASCLNAGIFPQRTLTKIQTDPLYKIHKITAESAKNMWEHYFIRPAEFILEMSETMNQVTLTTIGDTSNTLGPNNPSTFGANYTAITSINRDMLNASWKYEAERFKRIRNVILPPFYFTGIISIFAVALGIWGISGVNNAETTKDLLSPTTLIWLVGLPIGLSTFSLFMSILGIFNNTRAM